MNKILELSSRSSKGGRRKIKMVLLTLHNEGETNLNGISWKEEYVLNNLESIKGIPICASFVDSEDKEIPLDHGYTETVELGDGKSEPLFNNSECCGVIEDAKIEDLEIDGEMKRVLVGYGVLFYQRYKKFCDYVKENILLSEVKSSIEIVGKDGGAIVYDGGYNEKLRYPQVFDFSATAILGSVKEADENCYVLEVAQKKEQEETKVMDEKIIRDVIVTAINETNSKNDELTQKITELNSTIADKDAQITELNEKVEANKTSDADKDAKIEELNQKIAELEAQVNECKKAEQNSALDKALEGFTETEQKYAESEINSFRENPLEGNVDTVVNAINAGIGKAFKAAESKTSEQNSANNETELDIFSEINSVEDTKDEDVNIF